MTGTPKRAAIYASARVIRNKVLVLNLQIRLCEQHAQFHGYAINQDHIYEDDSVCPPLEREGYQQLLEAIGREEIDIVIMTDYNRLSLQQNEVNSVKEICEENGVSIELVEW